MKTKFFLYVMVWLAVFVVGCKETGKTGETHLAVGIGCCESSGISCQYAYVLPTGYILNKPGRKIIVEGGTEQDSKWYGNDGFGGVKMYSAVEAQQSITFQPKGVTGDGGRITGTGKRENLDVLKTQTVITGAILKNPSNLGMSAQMKYHTNVIEGWQGVSAFGYMNIDSYSSPDNPSLSNLTQNEITKIFETTEPLPETSFTASDTTLIAINGNNGGGYYEDLNGFVADNLTDPNDFLLYGAPSRFSILISTAEPINLSGKIFNGRITADSGDSIETTVEWMASDENLQRHIFRSGPFFAEDNTLDASQRETAPNYNRFTPFADPNINNPEQYVWIHPEYDDWLQLIDPNLLSDPNTYGHDPNNLYNPHDPSQHIIVSRIDVYDSHIRDILLPDRIQSVPVIAVAAQGDTLELTLDENDLDLMGIVLDLWLENSALTDLNQDGIFNLDDYMLMIND